LIALRGIARGARLLEALLGIEQLGLGARRDDAGAQCGEDVRAIALGRADLRLERRECQAVRVSVRPRSRARRYARQHR
jgi:hypothetical protein